MTAFEIVVQQLIIIIIIFIICIPKKTYTQKHTGKYNTNRLSTQEYTQDIISFTLVTPEILT